MYKFLIQTENHELIHDFAFHLKEAIKYQNWFYNEEKYKYVYSETGTDIHLYDIQEYIPIGSIEFVLNFYKTYHGIENIKPINIPDELNQWKYLNRTINNLKDLENINIPLDKKFFVKQIDKFKGITGIINIEDIPNINNGEFIISDIIKIQSEWRGFVYNNQLLDLRNYSGKFDLFPDIDKIKKMIFDYEDSPKAYTIDVAVLDDEPDASWYNTVLIEVHQFFSCGLYGFNYYKVLPRMFIATHKEIIKNKIS